LQLYFSLEHLPREAAQCEACLQRLHDRLEVTKGVKRVSIERPENRVWVEVEENADRSRIEETARKIMSEVASGYAHETLRIGGMDCPGCAKDIEDAIAAMNGILACSVDFTSRRMSVEFDLNRVGIEEIQRTIRQLGYSAQELFRWEPVSSPKEILILAIGGAFWLSAFFITEPRIVQGSLLLIAALVSGWKMLLSGIFSLMRANFTMNALMTIAVIGAAAIGEWQEAALVTWLFALGNIIQSGAMLKTQDEIRKLVQSAPKSARCKSKTGIEEKDVYEVMPGDLVEVLPFAQVPIDGVVEEGASTIHYSMLTGESEPTYVEIGSKVLAGGVNEGGYLVVRCEKPFTDTLYAKTLELIEEGQRKPTPQQELIDRFSAWYTPTVIVAAIVFAVVPPLVQWKSWYASLHQSFWLLMVACPCALVISTPVATARALGVASKIGALIKGGAILELASRIKHWIFDKTGTLTYGRLVVRDVVLLGKSSREDALRLACALAKRSAHPIANAISRLGAGMDLPDVSELHVEPGKGISGKINGKTVLLGSAQFIGGAREDTGTVAYLSLDNEPIARFDLAEKPKEEARNAIQEMKKEGMKITLLSGDDERAVRNLAEHLDIENYIAKASPKEKSEIVERIAREEPTAVVGDGINDVAAMQRSTLPIAMGAAGSAAAIEAADIVLLNDEIASIPQIIRLSKRYRRKIIENVAFSLLTKGMLLAAGFITPLPYWLAVVGDMGVSLLVIGNALRLRI